MAAKWIEGFESHIGTSQLQRKYASTSGSMASSAGRVFGVSGSVQSFVAVTPSLGLQNTWTIGFGCRLNNHTTAVNSNAQGIYFEKGVDEQFHIEMESTSGTGFRWHIYRGATLIDTSSYFDFGIWHYFELEFTARTGTNGAYELRHNGVQDINGTLVNLADEGTDGVDILAIRYVSNLSNTLFYDDLYFFDSTGALNNTFVGPSVVEAVEMSATGVSNDWANDSGGAQTANWDQVNDAPTATDEVGAGGTISSDTNAHVDLYNATDLAQITGNIHALQLGIQAAMSAAGSRTLRFKYRDPGGTIHDGNSFVVDDTTYDEFFQVFDQNPVTATAWDVNDIDDGQYGVEVVS